MQSVAEQLETIKKNFEKQKQALVAQGEKVYIVNAGNMNHGKAVCSIRCWIRMLLKRKISGRR